MDLTETEDIKKWQEYTEELYKKDLNDPDNHDSVIIHLEPDILECEVKWALGSITTHKASFQSRRMTMPKNIQTIVQLCSFNMLAALCSKFFKLDQQHFSQERPDVPAAFRKGRDPISNICCIKKSKVIPGKYRLLLH